jgi:hypothetical protein
MPFDQVCLPRPEALRLREHHCLLPAVPVLLVFALSSGLFELLAFDLAGAAALVRAHLPEPGARGAAFLLREGEARMFWSVSALVYLAVGLAGIAACADVAWQSVRGRCLAGFAAVGTVLAAASLAQILAAGDGGWALAGIYTFTRDSLHAAAVLSPDGFAAVRWVLGAINGFSALVPVVALIAGCTILAPPSPGAARRPDDVARQMRLLRELLNAASAIMVVGVLHMMSWLRWPAALVEDAGVRDAVNKLALAVTFYWGTTFSLMIAAFYIPAAVWLSRRGEAAIRAAARETPDLDCDKWLRERGLSVMPARQLPQLFVMLAPLLAGPLGSAITGFAGGFGG